MFTKLAQKIFLSKFLLFFFSFSGLSFDADVEAIEGALDPDGDGAGTGLNSESYDCACLSDPGPLEDEDCGCNSLCEKPERVSGM